METKVSYKDKQIIISPDSPFKIIGERINPTRRKKLAASMVEGDFSLVQQDAIRQVEAGAHILDVNAGIPGADEPAIILGAMKAVLEVVEVPLCFDSADPDVLKVALENYEGKALINSTTAEEAMMEKILPLVKEFGAAVIGVITDDDGIPATPEDRLATARKLIERAADYGIPAEDVVIDALALTVGADHNAGRVTLQTLDLIRKELGVNLNLGASNVSFGLPDRAVINTAYLSLAIANGLTTAITDPTKESIQTTLLACDLLMGHDEYAMSWIKAYRKRSAE
jgi:5-methyltetrahydrofolate--homocysteine methyltransferase